MRISPVPLVSTYNGPSYLLHVIEALSALRAPAARVRLLPVIDGVARPEAAGGLPEVAPEEIAAGNQAVRVAINVRDDSRLRGLLPLLAVGMVSADTLTAWQARTREEEGVRPSASQEAGDGLRAGYAAAYEALTDAQAAPREPGAAGRRDWSNEETPAERLARQLCNAFPALRDPVGHRERPSDEVLRFAQGEGYRATGYSAAAARYGEDDPDDPARSARDVAEVFLTQALSAVAAADLLGGFEWDVPLEPEGRRIDVVIDAASSIEDVVKWLHAYPHFPKPQIAFDEPLAAREQWDEYFAKFPAAGSVFETGPRMWTEEDPAVQSLYGAIRARFEAGRAEPLTPGEMLTLVRRHVPEFVPRYPRLLAVTGGMNLEGILLTLMACWLREGRFLGMDWDDWARFTAQEQALLCALIVQRRGFVDPCTLFALATRLLAHPEVECAMETFRPEPARLGKPLAQPGRTLALGGRTALHAPEVVAQIPVDRSRDEAAAEIEARLAILKRLFLPAHVPLRCVWKVDWPVLGRSAYMRQDGAAATAGVPLGVSRLPDGPTVYDEMGGDAGSEYGGMNEESYENV